MATGARQVLIVDDDREFARALERFLRRHGYTVSVENDADLARWAPPHAVGVFELEIAEQSGVTLAEELLASGQIEHAIFFTGRVVPPQDGRVGAAWPIIGKADGALRLLAVLRQVLS